MNQVLKNAYDKVSIKGFVEYKDFIELSPPHASSRDWSLAVKRILLDAGFIYHAEGQMGKWWGKCNYTQRRTHFHLYNKH